MAIQKILPTDKLNTGWRIKYNDTVDELIQAITYIGGALRVLKFSGDTYDINVDGNKRAGLSQIVAGENTIVFEEQYDEAATWVFTGKPYLFDSNGVEVGFTLVSKNHAGFVIDSVEAGTLNYQTCLISVNNDL